MGFPFNTAITCRWGKFIGDALLNQGDASQYTPMLSDNVNPTILLGVNNQISSSNQQVFPTVNPIDAINWADDSGRVGICTVSAVREEGQLASFTGTTTHAGAGGLTNTNTVPAGKKWTIKQVNYYYSGVQTVTSYDVTIYNPSNAETPYLMTGLTPTVNTLYTYKAEVPLTLTAGWRLRMTTTVSAWTSGTHYMQVIYQESDA